MERPKPKVSQFVIEVKGEEAAQRFRNLLDALEKSSNWGASRAFEIEWDGDGNNKLKVLDGGGLEPSFTREEFNQALNYTEIRVLSSKVVGLPRRPRSTQ